MACSTTRRGRKAELRVRTGCRRCRERRVKCPEQKPVCKSCEVRGYTCSYEIVLRWGEVDVSDSAGRHRCATSTHDWMFLNAGYQDFEDCRSSLSRPQPQTVHDTRVAVPDVNNEASHLAEIVEDTFWYGHENDNCLLPSLSPLQLSPVEVHLWEYFHKAISPSCVLNPNANPYQDVILRIAAHGGRTSPLLHGVLAISASQLYNLGNQSFLESSWKYRHQALRGLRLEIAKYEVGLQDVMRAGQMVAAVLLMCFMEISHDCADSWVLHADFGRGLIQSIEESQLRDPDIEALFTFANAYIVSHEIFAHTAWSPARGHDYNESMAQLSDDENLQTITGCSKEFLQILSSINLLAADVERCSKSTSQCQDIEILDQKRLELERRLHSWNLEQQPSNLDEDIPESILVAETKRLAGLLYLYSRTSHLGPRDPCILRLTSRILHLISKVTFRTNSVLWPLFMVATLGVRPECDADRAAVLERLDSLQRTRQLGSVKKARKLVDHVWNVRDLHASASNLGWNVLEMTACQDKISLA